MSAIIVKNLVKTFGKGNVIDDVSFTVDPGEILVILGASGCGKTTTLRCIAGLERPSSGSISIDGKVVADNQMNVPPEHRHLGMVFQSYALWPHMTVFDNVAYALRKFKKEEIREKVEASLALVGLEGFADRYPSMLSGGQQQRVALARSAAARPQVMLLDEPLSNLDAKLREHMRIELRRLINELGMTAIYITHDQSEAMALADKVIFMKDGKIEQQGTPREIYNRPSTQAVAQFIGSATFLKGTLSPGENGLAVVDIGSGFRLQAKAASGVASGRTTAAVRPERVRLSPVPSGAPFEMEGSVAQVVFLGDYTEYAIDIGDARVTARSQLVLDVGAKVFVFVKPDDVILLPASDDAGSKSGQHA